MRKWLQSPYLWGIISGIAMVVIYVYSFPKIELDYAMGLDNSYFWALNHLFVSDYHSLIRLTYPLGPLTFLKVPSTEGHNLVYFLVFYTFVKILFLGLFLRTAYLAEAKSYVFSFFWAFWVAYFADIDFLIIGTVALLLLKALRDLSPDDAHHRQTEDALLYYLLAAALATIGLFIKSSIGVISFSMFPVSWVYARRSFRDRPGLLAFFSRMILGTWMVFLILGLVVFHRFGLILDYVLGVFHLMSGYGALASFPENNWWYLSLFLGAVLLFPLMYRESKGRQAFFVLALPLFLMWKHAMSREDHNHNAILFGFLILFWGIIFVVADRKSWKLLVWPIWSLLAFYGNMSRLPGFRQISIDNQRVTYFNKWILHTQSTKDEDHQRMIHNLAKAQLSPEFLKIIGSETIDFFPWELTYAKANPIHWQPRQTLQSGHFSHWFDETDARAFQLDTGPEWLLFHLPDGQLNGLDEAYLLNDEPLVILSILSHYHPVSRQNELILYQKNTNSGLQVNDLFQEDIRWNQWVDVPQDTGAVMRVKVKFQPATALRLKTFLYKGQPFFIDYLTRDHALYTYRFTPSNAQDGLWVNPLFRKPAETRPAPVIQQIRLRTIDTTLVSNPIIQWQQLRPKNGLSPDDLFGKTSRKETLLLDTVLHRKAHFPAPPFLEEGIVSTEAYDYGFTIRLEDYWAQGLDSLHVRYQTIFKGPINTGTVIAYSVKDSPHDFWRSQRLTTKFLNSWNFAQASFLLTKEEYPAGSCTIVLWNPDRNPLRFSETRLLLMR